MWRGEVWRGEEIYLCVCGLETLNGAQPTPSHALVAAVIIPSPPPSPQPSAATASAAPLMAATDRTSVATADPNEVTLAIGETVILLTSPLHPYRNAYQGSRRFDSSVSLPTLPLSPSRLKRLLKGEGGCSRMTVSPTARSPRPSQAAPPSPTAPVSVPLSPPLPACRCYPPPPPATPRPPLSRLHLSASYLCSPAPVLTASPAPLGGGGGGGPSSAYELPCAEKLGDNKDLNMRLFRHV